MSAPWHMIPATSKNEEGARFPRNQQPKRERAMSKHFSITTSDGTTISATSCGEYRAEFGAPYRCDISLEAGDFYADLEEVGDTDEIVDQLEEWGVAISQDEDDALRAGICESLGLEL